MPKEAKRTQRVADALFGTFFVILAFIIVFAARESTVLASVVAAVAVGFLGVEFPVHASGTAAAVAAVLLDAARAAGLNLSATLERALERDLANECRKRWRQENRDAISAYNDRIEKHDTFPDEVRSF